MNFGTHFGWIARLATLVLLIVVSAEVPGEAWAQRTYGIDEDPIRLGFRALGEGEVDGAETHFVEAIENDYQVDRAKLGLAEVALRQGRMEDAEPLYRQAITIRQEHDRKFPEARAGLGLLLLRFDRTLEAAEEFDAALDEDDNLWAAIYGRARLLLLEEDWGGAKKLLEQGRKREGLSEGEDQYRFGMALHALGTAGADAAEKDALLALHLNPADPEYGTLVARIYDERGAPTLAIDAYENVLANPNVAATAPMLHALGGLYRKVRQFNDARDRYVRAVEIDPEYAPALKDLAELFRLGNQPQRSARTYLRYVQIEPNDVDALLALADVCIEIGQSAQAYEAATTAATLDPANRDAKVAVVRAGLRCRDPGAKAAAAQAFATLPADITWNAGDLVALADYEMNANELDRARTLLEQARSVDPELPDVRFQMGILELKSGHPAAAVESLTEAVRLRPDAAVYHLNLGIAYFQAGQHASAIPSFRSAIELNPDLTVGRLLLGQALAVAGFVSDAATEYRQVLDAEPRNVKALRGLAYCHIRSEDYAEAVASYRKAVDVEPGNADGWAGLGNAYLGLQNWDDAKEAFDRARAIDPRNRTMTEGMALLEQATHAAGKGR